MRLLKALGIAFLATAALLSFAFGLAFMVIWLGDAYGTAASVVPIALMVCAAITFAAWGELK